MNKKLLYVFILGIALAGAYSIYTIFFHMNNQVRQSFELINERLEESNSTILNQNIEFRKELFDNLKKEDQIAITKIDSLSSVLFKNIDILKDLIIPDIEAVQDRSKIDTNGDINNMLFINNALEGHKLVNTLNDYRNHIHAIIDAKFPKLTDELILMFNTDAAVVNNKKQSWLDYQFKGASKIEIYTKLTQIQANIHVVNEATFQAYVNRNRDQ